jgi:hypothetical protein
MRKKLRSWTEPAHVPATTTVERECARCGRPANYKVGALVLYETAGGGEAWMHRACAGSLNSSMDG